VDSPSKGEVSPCLEFWFLNPSACQVCLLSLVYHILFMPCILFEEPSILSTMFFLVVLRNFCKYYLGMTEKAHQAVAFLSWPVQTSLPEVRFDLTIHARSVFAFIVI